VSRVDISKSRYKHMPYVYLIRATFLKFLAQVLCVTTLSLA
jgi:hypothetical protein